jgi:pyruvate kinase
MNHPKDYRRQGRAKIVATIGPASSSAETLRQMILAGMDVARFNFSHGQPAEMTPQVSLIRQLSREMGVPVAILGDLRGPHVRIGEIEGGSVELETGQKLRLTPETVAGNMEQVSVSFPKLATDVTVGCSILLDDGNLEAIVEKIEPTGDILCQIARGGTLSSRRGLNLPGRRMSMPSVTQKDFAGIDFAIEQDFDFLALSFVQSVDDVRWLNTYLLSKGADIPVIAKIENKSALDDIEAIAHEAYGVMVARGDLALEMSIEDVPVAQKRIIAICRQAAVPVITATQMLESMITMPKPTRAEATDIANAILDGTDALMLSGETAMGKYPVEAIAIMSTIAARTERAWMSSELPGPPPIEPATDIDALVAYAGHMVAGKVKAKAIVSYTYSGATARRIACHRPHMPILALTAQPTTRQRLTLTWDVESDLIEDPCSTTRMLELARRQAQLHGVAGPGDTIVILAGMPYTTAGQTNLLKVEQIPPHEEEGHAQG